MSTRSKRVVAGRRRSSLYQETLDQRLNKLARKVNAIKPELKSFQAASAFTNVDDATGQIVYLSGIVQGGDVNARIGDKITAKSIQVNVKIISGNSATITSLFNYGVYLVRDSQSSGVIPVVSGTAQAIFDNPGPLQAIVNDNTKDRFKIVKKWLFSAGMLASGSCQSQKTLYAKLNHTMFYHDGTTAITGAGKNAYYLVCLSDDTTDTVDMAMFTEIRFTDP